MRRVLLTVAFLALVLPACANTERPEGIVERWLLSLNQGAAGEPERYAPERISERILPNWDQLEPGELDVIEVGHGVVISDLFGGDRNLVPFRVVTLNGDELRSAAVIAPGEIRVEGLSDRLNDAGVLPSDGGPRIDAPEDLTMWVTALGVAGLLIALTAGLMALVREPRPSEPDPRP